MTRVLRAICTQPTPRIGTIIGDHVLDVKLLAQRNVFKEVVDHDQSVLQSALSEQTLNNFASLPQSVRAQTRQNLIDLLGNESSVIFRDEELNSSASVPINEAKMHLPMKIGAFGDFLCSETHHDNVSTLIEIPSILHSVKLNGPRAIVCLASQFRRFIISRLCTQVVRLQLLLVARRSGDPKVWFLERPDPLRGPSINFLRRPSSISRWKWVSSCLSRFHSDSASPQKKPRNTFLALYF